MRFQIDIRSKIDYQLLFTYLSDYIDRSEFDYILYQHMVNYKDYYNELMTDNCLIINTINYDDGETETKEYSKHNFNSQFF